MKYYQQHFRTRRREINKIQISLPFHTPQLVSNHLPLIQGRSQGGGPGVPVTPPFVSLFKQTTYNRWRKRHDNILTLTQCDPPLGKSWLRPC